MKCVRWWQRGPGGSGLARDHHCVVRVQGAGAVRRTRHKYIPVGSARAIHGARRSAALLPHPRPLLRCCSRASPLPICPRCLTYSAPHNWGGKGAPLRCSTCEWPWNWRDFANLHSLQNSRGGRGGETADDRRPPGKAGAELTWTYLQRVVSSLPAPTASGKSRHCSKFTRPHQCQSQSPGTPANVMSCFPPQVFSL